MKFLLWASENILTAYSVGKILTGLWCFIDSNTDIKQIWLTRRQISQKWLIFCKICTQLKNQLKESSYFKFLNSENTVFLKASFMSLFE